MTLGARLLVAAFLLFSFHVGAQIPSHGGVFPGRLPADITLPPPTGGLSPPWQQATISTGTGGGATSSSNVLTDVCKGGVGFTADTGNLVYQSLSGDQEMIGQLQSITADTAWARYAPMVRQSTATGSKYFGLFFLKSGTFAGNWRLTLDAHNDYVGFDTPYTTPQWWRIVRTGAVFAGYVGPTSAGPWTLNGSQSVTMSDPVLWGVFCENGGDANVSTEVSTLPSIQAPGGSGNGTLQFTSAAQSINENGGTIGVTVSRVGGSMGAIGVSIARAGTSNASPGVDYTDPGLPYALTWSNGDTTTRTMSVTVLNRAGSQASRHLDMTLTSATGGAVIGSPSTQVLTINDVSAGAQTKLRAGYYTDCYGDWMPHGGDFNHFIGSDGYTAFRQCVDWSATQTGVKGVMIPLFWASLEGDTAGSYDGSVGNGLASAGKIGFPLIHDMLNYAAAKHLTVILELDWFNYYSDANCALSQPNNSPQAAYYVLGLLPRYLLPTSCTGTDSSNTYSGAFQPTPGNATIIWLKLWKPAVMTRWIALLNAYAAEFDNDPALEAWIVHGEEGDSTLPYDGSMDGYTFAALDTQFQRVVSEVKPNYPHTDIIFATAWMRHTQDVLAEAATSASKAVSISSNNTSIVRTDYGQAAYLGVLNPPDNTNSNTHNYQGELGYNIWLATPYEICPAPYDGTSLGGYTTFTQKYNALMSSGFTGSAGRALKPSRWILSNYKLGIDYCPSEVANGWGTIGGSGVYNFIQTHQINTACPSRWTGGCNTTQP